MSSTGMDARSGIFGCGQSMGGTVAFTSADSAGCSGAGSSADAHRHSEAMRQIESVPVFIATITSDATEDRNRCLSEMPSEREHVAARRAVPVVEIRVAGGLVVTAIE